MGSIPTPGADARIGSSEIGLDVQHASPPTDAYVGKDDSLWIMCSNNGTATVTVNARFLMPSGEIKLNQWTLSFSLSRAAQFKQIQLPECFLLSVAVVNNTINSATNVSCYVAAIVSRSAPTAFNAAQTLCQGYSSGTMAISWPTGVNSTNVDCAGVIHVLVGTTPAAGAEISETVPANAKWRLRLFTTQLTSAAGGGSRFPGMLIDDGSNRVATIFSAAGQGPGGVVIYTWAPGLLAANASAGGINNCIPQDLILYPGYRIRTLTANIAAGDQYTAPQYEVEEWLLP